MKAGCQTRRGWTHDGARRLRALAARDGIGVSGAPHAPKSRGRSCADFVFLTTAAGAAAARRTSGRSAGLVALPLFDRFAAKAPVAADTEAGQASLSQEAVDRRWMNPQVFRQFLDGENLVALRYLSHTLDGLTRRRRFLRRPFFHALRPLNTRSHLSNPSLCCVVSGVKMLCASGKLKLRASACESVRGQ